MIRPSRIVLRLLPLALATLAPVPGAAAARAALVAPVDSAPRRAPERSLCGDATLPMRDWGGRPAVEVFVGDRGPLLFHIDTGTSAAVVLGTKLQTELGAELAPTGKELRELRLGDAVFRGVPVETFDFEAFGGVDAPAGILGLPLFADCLLTLDYPRQEVQVKDGLLPANDPDVLSYRTDPANDDLIVVPIELAGKPFDVHLDSGSPAEVTLLNRSAAELPLAGEPVKVGIARTPSGEAVVRTAKLTGELRLGRFRLADPRIEFADLGPMVDGGVGNIGSALLGRFALTLDQRNRRLRFHEAESGGAAEPGRVVRANRSRYGIGAMMHPEPDALVVQGVVPGDAAEAAGLQAGDRIVTVNGSGIGTLEPRELGALFGAPEPVRLGIERDGRRVELSVTPRER
ncbi:MAG: aspartyl protease family protein [Thermoanaerobaculia bacterium]